MDRVPQVKLNWKIALTACVLYEYYSGMTTFLYAETLCQTEPPARPQSVSIMELQPFAQDVSKQI